MHHLLRPRLCRPFQAFALLLPLLLCLRSLLASAPPPPPRPSSPWKKLLVAGVPWRAGAVADMGRLVLQGGCDDHRLPPRAMRAVLATLEPGLIDRCLRDRLGVFQKAHDQEAQRRARLVREQTHRGGVEQNERQLREGAAADLDDGGSGRDSGRDGGSESEGERESESERGSGRGRGSDTDRDADDDDDDEYADIGGIGSTRGGGGGGGRWSGWQTRARRRSPMALQERLRQTLPVNLAEMRRKQREWVAPMLQYLFEQTLGKIEGALAQALFKSDPHTFTCPASWAAAWAAAPTRRTTHSNGRARPAGRSVVTGRSRYSRRDLMCVVSPEPVKEVVRVLLQRGASINHSGGGARRMTPLHWAAVMGDVDIVQFLLSLGADPGATDVLGRMPVHVAAAYGYTDIVTMLLDPVKGPSPMQLAPVRTAITQPLAVVVVGGKGGGGKVGKAGIKMTKKDRERARARAKEREEHLFTLSRLAHPCPFGGGGNDARGGGEDGGASDMGGDAAGGDVAAAAGTATVTAAATAESATATGTAQPSKPSKPVPCDIDSVPASKFDAGRFYKVYVQLNKPLLVRGWTKRWSKRTVGRFEASELATAFFNVNVSTFRGQGKGALEAVVPLGCFLTEHGIIDGGFMPSPLHLATAGENATCPWTDRRRGGVGGGGDGGDGGDGGGDISVFDSKFIMDHFDDTTLKILRKDLVHRLLPHLAADDASPLKSAGRSIMSPQAGMQEYRDPDSIHLLVGAKGACTATRYHGTSVDVLFHGRKRWDLFPPMYRSFGRPPGKGDSEERGKEGVRGGGEGGEGDEASDGVALTCTQAPGDMLLIPRNWAYATRSLREYGATVAVQFASPDLNDVH